MPSASCTFLGCTEPCVARGLCNGHYLQHQGGKTLRTLIHRRRRGDPILPCTGPRCNRARMGNLDLCRQHQRQQRHGLTLTPIRFRRYYQADGPIPLCQVPGCSRNSEGNDPLCRMHRARLNRLDPLAPQDVVWRAIKRKPRLIPWLTRKKASAA